MSAIYWNRKCPNCTGKQPKDIETIDRMFEWAKPGMFPGTCWYCQGTGSDITTPLEYLNLLKHQGREHYGVSADTDREIEKCLNLPTDGLEPVPIPFPQSRRRALFFTGFEAGDPDISFEVNENYALKDTFKFGLHQSLLSLPFDFVAGAELWKGARVEIRIKFFFLVHLYKAGISGVFGQFIIRSRLTQTRVELSPRIINPNDGIDTRLLPEKERLFIYPV